MTLAKSKIKRTQRATLRIVTTIPSGTAGIHPVGQLVIRDGGKVVAIKTLKPSAKGTLVVKLPRLKKGKHFLRVSLRGNSNQVGVSSSYRVLRVK